MLSRRLLDVRVSVDPPLGIQNNLDSTNLVCGNNKRAEKDDIRDTVNKGYFRHIADMFGGFRFLVSVSKCTKIGFKYSFKYTTKLG